MKKIIFLAVAVATLALASCKSGGSDSTSGDSTAVDTTKKVEAVQPATPAATDSTAKADTTVKN